MLLHFVVFDLEDTKDDETCLFDHLSIYDGINGSAPRVAKLCGSTLPENITSSGTALFLVFTSDNSNVGLGFTINYKEALPEGTWKL